MEYTMGREGIKYYVVDAFAKVPLNGNPAAVMVLGEEKEEDWIEAVAVEWMQAVAREFNISATCFLTKIISDDVRNSHGNARFGLRWFAPHAELNICGHGTVASAYVLFSTGMVKDNKIEFISPSAGIVTATRLIDKEDDQKTINDDYKPENGNIMRQQQQFMVQLGFPLIPTIELDPSELELVPKSLFGPSTIHMAKMSFGGDLLLELSSSKLVTDLEPALDEIGKWPGRGVIVTGAAPPASGFDFFSRFFLPNSGIPEDPVCGSVHCSLGPYWSEKLGKSEMKAYMASSRGGILNLKVNKDQGTVFIAGHAALAMEGLLYV